MPPLTMGTEMTTNTAVRPQRRSFRLVYALVVAVVGLVASAAIVWHASYSAFSSQTSTPNNNWAAGTVALSDDDANGAAFTASGLKPGSSGSKCIVVTSSGSLASVVKLYAANASTTNDLASHITLTITAGNGGSFGDCGSFTPLASGSDVYTGELADFVAAKKDYSTGLAVWSPNGNTTETRTFKIAYVVDATTPNTSQGGTAKVDFTWEAQNTPAS